MKQKKVKQTFTLTFACENDLVKDLAKYIAEHAQVEVRIDAEFSAAPKPPKVIRPAKSTNSSKILGAPKPPKSSSLLGAPKPPKSI